MVTSFHHLRRDLLDVFDHTCDVIHTIAQLLCPSFDAEGLQPRIRILECTDHRAFAVVATKLELRVPLEVRNTLVHIVTAVHSTFEPWTRLQDVDRALVERGTATCAPLPCETSSSCEKCCWAHWMSWLCSVVIVLCEQPTASLASKARVYCGFRPGPTCVTPPSRQDDGNVRAPARVCTLVVCVCCRVRGERTLW